MRFNARSLAVVMASSLSGATLAQVPTPTQVPVEWKVGQGGNGHWYQGVRAESATPWMSFADLAAQRGGHLATISGGPENLFVFDVSVAHDTWWASGFAGPYLGARKQANGAFAWMTGETWSYTNWRSGEPNSSGEVNLQFMAEGQPPHSPSPKWNDTDDSNISAMIEWSADCNSDGQVDYGQIRRGQLADLNGNNIPDCCEQGQACVAQPAGTFPVEWKASEGGNGHWYLSTFQSGTWTHMRSLAVARGADLASIHSAAQNAFVWDLASSTTGPANSVWIGGRRINGKYSWCDGSAWDYTRWSTGEPCCGDTDAFIHLQVGGGWNDHNETTYSCHGLFEWSADCNVDGMVDYGQILRGELADQDANGVPDCCTAGTPCRACAADLDGNGLVEAGDIGLLLLQYGGPGTADLDRDGVVSSGDIGVMLLSFGPCA